MTLAESDNPVLTQSLLYLDDGMRDEAQTSKLHINFAKSGLLFVKTKKGSKMFQKSSTDFEIGTPRPSSNQLIVEISQKVTFT